MPKNIAIQNNFTKGLITEATGLNFPENACTSASNCVFTLIGDVIRREGIDYELNFLDNGINTPSTAISSYVWKNAGGQGINEIVVLQIGGSLYFYLASNSTVAGPLSTTKISGSVALSSFQASGNDPSQSECQFTSGNGYLFVFHPGCDPFYCTYDGTSIVANSITVQIRDFIGIVDNLAVNTRPASLSTEHNYNLLNQGWASTNTVQRSATATSNTFNNITGPGNYGFTVAGGLTINNGDAANVFMGTLYSATGTVNSYSGTLLVINVTALSGVPLSNAPGPWTIATSGTSTTTLISTWHTALSNYPSNSDIWWTFKNTSNVFDPTNTVANVTSNAGPSPKGYYILNAFSQQRSSVSGLGITSVATGVRPRTGAWFQGRVWYAGVDASQAATGDESFYTWSENIYFSQIITNVSQFGYCYQTNDPTSQTLSDILPSDGGVITIQGCGAIYKLFPVQNGMLVFAQNGVWFITGGSQLGFTAIDYSINKISAVQSISGTSFIDVVGLPYFWNEEGIYMVMPIQGNVPYGHGGFTVEPITVGTILTFYNSIPKDSKRFARGDYNPLTYVLQWVYRSTQETGIVNRYNFDSALNLNIANKAFYPYAVSSVLNTTPFISGIFYLNYPNSANGLTPLFKYVTTKGATTLTFSEERDTTFKDWVSTVGQNYTSTFTTGYNLQGKGVLKWQPTYVYMYSRNESPWTYSIQGVWDYSINQNSGKQSSTQTVVNQLGQPNFGTLFRRHKIRGHGSSLQINVSSVDGNPFDIIGWTLMTNIDAGV